MAYNSSSYSGSDYGEYNFNSYVANYDYVQIPAFGSYNCCEYSQSYYGYDPSLYFAPNYSDLSYSTIAYSATTFSDPKSVEYDPNHGMTQLVISYSTMEFNEPEFDEYDSTPYDGGYDIAQTYGKPLLPSEEICYPRSGSSTNNCPAVVSVPAGPVVPLTTVEEVIEEKATKPQNGKVGQVTEEKPQLQESSRDQAREVEDNSHEGEDKEESHREDDEYYSGSGNENGLDNAYSGGQLSEEHERQVPPQYPSGYGLEALDLCESLFGYWPCLSRMKKRGNLNCCEEVIDGGNHWQQENMWKGTADYLFGNPYPYSGRGEDRSSYGELVYAYERHYPTDAQYRQNDFDYES